MTESVQETINKLEDSITNTRAEDLCRMLVNLGFKVKDGNKGGHKVLTHKDLPKFLSSSYNAGAKRNGIIKKAYIKQIIKVLKTHKEDF